jgi:type IV secretory pathway TrbF-like protein
VASQSLVVEVVVEVEAEGEAGVVGEAVAVVVAHLEEEVVTTVLPLLMLLPRSRGKLLWPKSATNCFKNSRTMMLMILLTLIITTVVLAIAIMVL